MGKYGVCILIILASFSGYADDLDDDVVSSNEFSAYMPIEDVIIHEDLIVKTNWQQPFFIKDGEKNREVASNDENAEPIGLLKVVQEIPYSYPWLTHRVLQKRMLNKVDARAKRRRKK